MDQRCFGFREYEAGTIIKNLVGDKKEVLNIGCWWGRDYFFLEEINKNVTNLDLQDQNLPNMVVADITRGLPFKDKTFDVVLLPEVIEHIVEDGFVLSEIRRVLKDNGFLVLTVPYMNDKPEFHIRIHSPKTIKRLLKSQGFDIKDYIERGGLISIYKPISFSSRVIKTLFGKSAQRGYLNFFVGIDFYLGRGGNNLFKRNNGCYGGYIKAVKGSKQDFAEVNAKEFC